MQMYVLAALLGATSAIKNHMPTAVAAPAAASGATAVPAMPPQRAIRPRCIAKPTPE